MVLKRGEIWDMWNEGMGRPYYLYYLIDPRKDKVCYIGLTKQEPKNRLLQHKNPVPSNEAPIAKLQRHLKELDMSLEIEVVAKGSKKLIGIVEEWAIKMSKSFFGEDSLKNLQLGGFNGYGLSDEAKKKMWATKKKRSHLYAPKSGEDNASSKVTKQQVLEIYSMINNFYSNKEIIKELDLDIKTPAIDAIRKGKNWESLFLEQQMKFIPSLNVVEGALNSQEKLDVLLMVDNSHTTEEIRLKYRGRLSTTDINRIRNKTLWKMAINVYENYYKPNKDLN